MAAMAQEYLTSDAGDPMPRPPADSCPESSKAEMVKTLRSNLQDLAEEDDKIEKEKVKILDELYRLKLTNSTPVPDLPHRHVQVIAFVKALQKAIQFFELKDSLKKERLPYHRPNRDNLECFKYIVKHHDVRGFYRFLDPQDILDAVNETILHLQIENDSELKLAINNFSPNSEEDNKPFTLLRYANKGGGPALNAIVKLVYEVREKGYIMERDPWEEIILMKKHNPNFYARCFIKGLLEKFSEKTVKVYNVPVRFGERKVKALFQDCGRIESIKFEQFGDDWSKIAYITFETSEGAKLAPILKGESYLWVEPLQEESHECHPTLEEYSRALYIYELIRNSKGRSYVPSPYRRSPLNVTSIPARSTAGHSASRNR